MVLVYVFNYIDRQILSILAEDIKADLGITDSDLGFLYGTAFAVFFAVFGIPLGRLADVWNRKNLIAIGISFWSAMTMLSGTARGFASLAIYRFGVGVGEASASPAIYSILSDYFPPKLRTTVLAIYNSGLYIGAGIGIALGGIILDAWKSAYPDPSIAPFGLKGWQIAFFAMGMPGLLVGFWVSTLREPRKGLSEGIFTKPEPHPFREAWFELLAVLPVSNLFILSRLGATTKSVMINVMIGLAIALLIFLLIEITGDTVQWIALGIGLFCAIPWVQSLAYRDPATFAMIFKCKTFIFTTIGIGSYIFVIQGTGFWIVPFLLRVYESSAGEIGTIIGISTIIGGFTGVPLGGVLADKLRQYTPRAKLYVLLGSILIYLPLLVMVLNSRDINTAYIYYFLVLLVSSMSLGPGVSTIVDQVMPRMRAISSSFYIMVIVFIGFALGPYMVGLISDIITATGVDSGVALKQSMFWALMMLIITIIAISLAIINVETDEASRIDRARALGEEV